MQPHKLDCQFAFAYHHRDEGSGEAIMSSIAISSVVFVLVFGGALLGILLRAALPEHYLNADSKEVVKLGMALVSTMAALVLGLLIASAKSSLDAQNAGLMDSSAKVVLSRPRLGSLWSGNEGNAGSAPRLGRSSSGSDVAEKCCESSEAK